MKIGAVYVNWLLEGSVERYSMKDLGGRWQVNDPVSLLCLVEDRVSGVRLPSKTFVELWALPMVPKGCTPGSVHLLQKV